MQVFLLTLFIAALIISFIGMVGATQKEERKNCLIAFAISVFASLLIYLKG